MHALVTRLVMPAAAPYLTQGAVRMHLRPAPGPAGRQLATAQAVVASAAIASPASAPCAYASQQCRTQAATPARDPVG